MVLGDPAGSHLLGKGALDFMGSLNGEPDDDCVVVSPAWAILMADVPNGSIDVLAGLWLAALAEEYQGAALDEGELRRGLHNLVGVYRKARDDGLDVAFVWS